MATLILNRSECNRKFWKSSTLFHNNYTNKILMRNLKVVPLDIFYQPLKFKFLFKQPKSYEFGYAVKDDYSGTDYNRQEISDGHKVQGEYRVHLPDGRLQIVTYYADDKTGYHADVRYEYPSMNNAVNEVNYSPYKYNDYYKKRKRSI